MKVDLWFVQCTIVTVNFNLYLLLTYKLPVLYTTFISHYRLRQWHHMSCASGVPLSGWWEHVSELHHW